MPSDNETSTMKIRRKPTWREKENNKMRERKRRAITTNIFNGLRAQGNYNLSKNCDTNEVLKALCNEAGWEVEQDGTTYRKGNGKPPLYNDAGTSTRAIPFPYSPNPSLVPPSFPTPIPSCQLNPMYFPSVMMSSSSPMTPPIYSQISKDAKSTPTWDSISKESMDFSNYPFATSSTPASPKHQNMHTSMNFQPFAQSPPKVPTSSSFKIFGVQVQPRIGKENHGERFNDLELTLAIGKGRN
ncbi:unnamed protein product [Lathyrus oleraceus]